MKKRLRLRQYVKMAAQNLYLPAVYGLYRHRPLEEGLILFADAHHDHRPENLSLLAEELSRRGAKVEEMYLDYQRNSFWAVLAHMTRFMKRYAQARAVVICDNFLPAASCRKKKETMLVQLWHACGALKRFGYDTPEDIPPHYRGNVFRGTDLVTVSAPFCVGPFASAMRLKREAVQALGVSRTDRYFDESWRKGERELFFQAYPEARGRKVVLWAPTFRGSPGDPQVIDLDIGELSRRLGGEYLVLASLHPHMAGERQKMACRLSTDQMLPVTDVLIADYSSLVFDYCLLGRGLVLYTPDYEDYVRRRGFYMDYEEIPGIRAESRDQLAEAVRRAARQGMDPEKRERFLRTYMTRCDGQATMRIADRIFAQEGGKADEHQGSGQTGGAERL